jgi:hypothetical protein
MVEATGTSFGERLRALASEEPERASLTFGAVTRSRVEVVERVGRLAGRFVELGVNLPASTPPITRHGSHRGHAFFWIGWTGRGGCLHEMAGPDRLRITVPINGTTLDVPARAADGGHIGACQSALYAAPFTAIP